MHKHSFLFHKSDSVLHKLFWDSFWVMLASELSATACKLIDSLMVSNFMGTQMLAAHSLVFPLFALVSITSGFMATGSQVAVSKNIVKGQFKEADQAFTLSVLIGLIVAATLSGVCLLFGDLITTIFGATREDPILFAATKAYLTGIAVGIIPLTLNVILAPVMQINGDRARVKFTMILAAAINISFNYLFALNALFGHFALSFYTKTTGALPVVFV